MDMKSAVYRRGRMVCQIVAIACAAVLLGIVNSDLRHWRFAFVASSMLIACGTISMIGGMVLARLERTEQEQDER
jgi:hypothetical protein